VDKFFPWIKRIYRRKEKRSVKEAQGFWNTLPTGRVSAFRIPTRDRVRAFLLPDGHQRSVRLV
jgi:hypothetical protein